MLPKDNMQPLEVNSGKALNLAHTYFKCMNAGW